DHWGRAVVRVAASWDHPTVPKVAVTVTSAAHKAGSGVPAPPLRFSLGSCPEQIASEAARHRSAPPASGAPHHTTVDAKTAATRPPGELTGTGTGTGTGVSGRDCQPGFLRRAVGVVGRAHHRPGSDVGEAQR